MDSKSLLANEVLLMHQVELIHLASTGKARMGSLTSLYVHVWYEKVHDVGECNVYMI